MRSGKAPVASLPACEGEFQAFSFCDSRPRRSQVSSDFANELRTGASFNSKRRLVSPRRWHNLRSNLFV